MVQGTEGNTEGNTGRTESINLEKRKRQKELITFKHKQGLYKKDCDQLFSVHKRDKSNVLKLKQKKFKLDCP